MLSFANIRKTKAHTVTLLLLFLITSILLNAGLLVFSNFGSYFETITKELNASNMIYILPSRLYSDKVDNFMKTNANVANMQKETGVHLTASVPYNGDTRSMDFMFYNSDHKRDISKWKFVGSHLEPDSMSVYVPYVMSVDGGYKLNDKLTMKYGNKTLTFTIKGFTEDVWYSSIDFGLLSMYLPHDTYETVKKQIDGDTTIICANLVNPNIGIESGIKDAIKQDKDVSQADADNALSSIGLPLVRMARTMMATMVSAMTVAFAAIIALVCMVVIRFRIGNSIEEDMTKIGSLKAMGYTSRQVIASVVLQFSLIALFGSIAGILLSYSITPVLSDVFAHQSGLMWVQGFDPMVSGITLFSILLVVILVSLITSRRIHKLNPIVALRSGIVTHSFRKNHVPLEKSKGSLPFVLALKSILQNKKQSLMICLILAFVAFASAFSVVMFYNTTIDTTTFAQTPGIEVTNATIVFNPAKDNTQAVAEIKEMSGVRKAQYIDNMNVTMEGKNILTYIMDDYSQRETNSVYEGRYPLHNNEIVIGGILADTLQKKIGDTVTVKSGSSQADYIITGLSQGSAMGGLNATIRTDGIRRLNSEFKQQTLQIYLNKGVKASEFVKELKLRYGKTSVDIEDADKEFEQGMGIYTSIISKVGIVTLIINILVVLLVLYFVINSSVIRKKRELGIQKAVGFTTLQLMNQISLGFLPPITIGVILGSVLGITQTNALMTVAQHSMNIMKANYVITPGWIALVGTVIVVVSYLTSLLITYRIRKISAYALVSE